MTDEPEELVEPTDEDSEISTPFKYSITSYGADYPVDGLVKRIVAGDVLIPAFQRSYIWTLPRASRFIESLLLGLPVPGIFLSKDEPSQKLLVIDGQQRLKSLQFFYEGIFLPTERRFSLQGVQGRFEGATYRSLADEDRRRLDDSILHATIVRQDEPSEDQSSIYYIFERLNTGGVVLQPQEIRACIYHGPFNELLKELNSLKAWRDIYGTTSPRMRDQELILRFLALYFRAGEYTRPLKAFLNDYMGKNRFCQLQDRTALAPLFAATIELIARTVGHRAFRPKRALNAAVFDAVMVGLGRRIARGSVKDETKVSGVYQGLLQSDGFMALVERSTTDEETVRRRLSIATDLFARLQ